MNPLNAREYIERFLKIRNKDGRVVPLRLNRPQRRLYETIRALWAAGKPVRVVILKARQMGFSTLTEAVLFFLTATSRNTESMIVAHKDEATANLFRMSRFYYDHLPAPVRPMLRSSNARELAFDAPARAGGEGAGLSSRIRCSTAGGSGVGRSYTLRCLHLSEFAFWPGDKLETFTGLVQAVPDRPGTVIVVESTANGYDAFKDMWDRAVDAQREGRDGFVPVFFPWFEMEEYRRTPPPGFSRTDEEEELARTFGLDDAQLAWRRWCVEEQCQGDLNLFRQEYPATPDEAFIATGACAFDKEALVRRREQVRGETWERGRFHVEYGADRRIARWTWQEDARGPVRLRRRPEAGVPYVIGGDTAGTGSDFFAGQVLDNRTGEQVAVLHHQFGERAYAEQMYALGMFYNQALIGIETNYSTFPEVCLEEMGYTRLYVRQRVDTFTGRTVDAFGFQTTRKSRELAVDGLRDAARKDISLFTDYDTLGEMLTFVYDENWKPQAEVGAHDDLVMALAIAHYIRPQQRYAPEGREEPGRAKWTRDMWEDYNSASREERQILLERWGRPAAN